jgi:hypothetical protein
MLVVGTRGRNLKGVQSLLPGSVSKYCLQQSPIPVIVVRPSPKREKKKKKRRADPTRRSYNHILELSEKRGSGLFNPNASIESEISKLPDEEAAVAKALGLPASYSHANSRSSLSVSDRSSISQDESDSPSPVPYSLDSVVMKSPLNGSPASSEESVVVSEDTQRGMSPGPSARSRSPPPDYDSADDTSSITRASTAEKTDGEDSDAETSVHQIRVSIPVIEVSNDQEKTESQKQ